MADDAYATEPALGEDPNATETPGGATTAGTRPIERSTLHQEVAQRIRDLIFEGQLTPGHRVPERVLCERFAISRTPLRQALVVLAAEGLVDLLPHRGATVAALSVEAVDQMFEVMEVLEGLAGRLSCARIGDAELAELQVEHRRMVEAYERGDRREYFQRNQNIHSRIVEIAGNPVLHDVYTTLNGRMRRARYLANLNGERWRQAIAEHEAMLDALAARDGERLAHILQTHLKHKWSAVRAYLLTETALAEE